MNTVRKYYLRMIIKAEKIKIDNRFFVFLFFLFVATIFWLLNALSKEYSTEITYPVTYTNIPANQLLLKDPPQELTLNVSAFGFILMKHNFRKSILPLRIKTTSPPLVKVKGTRKKLYYLLTSDIKQSLDNQLTNDIVINDISPDTIVFEFIDVIKKKIPVKANFDVKYAPQYTLKTKYNIKPDSIIVYGKKNILDTLKYILTERHTFKDIAESFDGVFYLQNYENLKLSHTQVEVNVPVEKFTQVKFEIKIEAINVPYGVSLKTFPSKVKVSYLVGYSEYYNVKKDEIKAVVDYNSISEGQKRIKVKIQNVPENIIPNSISIHPTKLDYIIEH